MGGVDPCSAFEHCVVATTLKAQVKGIRLKLVSRSRVKYGRLLLPGQSFVIDCTRSTCTCMSCLDAEAHFVRFEDDGRIVRGSRIDLDGTPFVVVGSKLMECHQGPSHIKHKECSVG